MRRALFVTIVVGLLAIGSTPARAAGWASIITQMRSTCGADWTESSVTGQVEYLEEQGVSGIERLRAKFRLEESVGRGLAWHPTGIEAVYKSPSFKDDAANHSFIPGDDGIETFNATAAQAGMRIRMHIVLISEEVNPKNRLGHHSGNSTPCVVPTS